MERKKLIEIIRKKSSFLCVGLDTDLEKIPSFLKTYDDPVFEFNRRIVDATIDYAAAYKPNIAFYESQGSKGWKSLEKTMSYIQAKKSEVFTIADAKRGDIGNSAAHYAKAFFETMNFDAITVSPYMGYDSLEPFLSYPEKWTIVLAITSNKGSEDFQQLAVSQQESLYMNVIEKCVQWGTPNNLMFVCGATQPKLISQIRKIAQEHFLLVPGVGAQGGDMQEVAKFGLNMDCGLLVNASRSIIYASNGENFDIDAGNEAKRLARQMAPLIK